MASRRPKYAEKSGGLPSKCALWASLLMPLKLLRRRFSTTNKKRDCAFSNIIT